MGVNTKAWGPSAWTFFHGLALAIDTSRRTLNRDSRRRLDRDARDLFSMLKDVLPCIHCRRSFGGFSNMEPTVIARVGTEFTPGPEGFAFSYFMYRMHERVNNKLFWQDTKKMSGDKVMDKWMCYQPEFDTVIATTAPPNTREFKVALCHFVFYALHDFDIKKEPARCDAIVKFVYKLATVTSRLGFEVGEQMERVLMDRPLRIQSQLRERVCVWNRVQAHLLGPDSVYCMSVDDRLDVCEKAVVHC